MTNEVFGDATRGDAWAAVRLEVDGDTIVAADAPGLDRSLDGLTLVEAAAVDGEPLAVEALASALGHAFTATPRPGRVAVAMSGGVDSAVALRPRRAGRDRRDAPALAGPGCARHRARVLLAGRGRGGARDVSRARAPARDARPARGVQARDRRSVHACVRRGGDAESVHALQRRVSIRRARGIRKACRRRRAVDGPLRAHRRARRAPARRACGRRATRISPTCSRPSIRRCSSVCGSRSASRRRRRRVPRRRRRAWRRRRGARARRRASSAATTTARSSSARAFASSAGADRRRGRHAARRARRPLEVHARPAARAGRQPERGRSTSCAPTRRRTP